MIHRFQGTKFLLVFFLLTVLQGCKSPITSAMEGVWIIEPASFIFNGIGASECIAPNVIFFRKNGTCTFPGIVQNCGPLSPDRGYQGHWSVREDNGHAYILELRKAHGLFPKEMHIWFSKDEQGKWFIMHFESESLRFFCKKNMFDLDGNQRLVDRVIDLTTGVEPGSN